MKVYTGVILKLCTWYTKNCVARYIYTFRLVIFLWEKKSCY